MRAEIQLLRLGSVLLVGLPGELFGELRLRIKAALPDVRVLVLGYTNGNVGYVPTRAAFAEGGYEVVVAQRARVAA